MAILDDINKALRDFERYSGDGQPNAPVGHPLPVGDPRSGIHDPSKKGLRDVLIAILQAMGDPAALQTIIDQLSDKADIENAGKIFGSRQQAIETGQSEIPFQYGRIVTIEGDVLVIRQPGEGTDNLFPSFPFWGDVVSVDAPPARADMLVAKVPAPVDGVSAYRQNSNLGTFIGWPEMTIDTVTGPRAIPSRASAYLQHGVAVVASLAGTGPMSVSQQLMTEELLQQERDGDIIILVASNPAGLSGRLGETISRSFGRGKLLNQVSAYGLGAIETTGLEPSHETGRVTRVIDTAGWYPLQPTEDGATVRFVNPIGTIDLAFLPSGRSAVVEAPSGCIIHAGAGAFAGQTGNTATFAARAIFRVMRLGGVDTLIEPIVGTPTYSSSVRPAAARSLLFAGQSHVALGCIAGLIGGFSDALHEGTFVGGMDNTDTNYIVSGASNSAAARTSSDTRYWWDVAAATPGPYLDDAVAAIQAASAAGHPLPEAMIWRLGETDAPAVGNGTTTYEDFKSAIASIWQRLRTESPGMRIIVSPPGSNDRPIAFVGMMGVRNAYRELAEENPDWVSLGHEMYDLPRPYDWLHLSDQGYYAAGIRDAMSYKNALSPLPMGPEVTSAVNQPDGTVKVTISMANGLTYPPEEDVGPYPYGLCIINNAQGTMVQHPVIRGTAIWNGATMTVEVTLYPVSNPAGMYLFTIPGWYHEVRRRSYIRDNKWHGRSPGFPLRFQRLGPL